MAKKTNIVEEAKEVLQQAAEKVADKVQELMDANEGSR